MLPQVLAGLGAVSIASAGCGLWLDALKPLFAAVAVAAVTYQSVLVWRRPARSRTRKVYLILAGSIGVNLMVSLVWVWWSLRYA